MLEQTNEIMEVMGTPYGLPDDVDEADLEAGTIVVHVTINLVPRPRPLSSIPLEIK